MQVVFLLVYFAIEKDGMKGINWTSKRSRQRRLEFRDKFFPTLEDDVGKFSGRSIIIKMSYLEILISDKDNLGGVGKLIQRVAKPYFMNIF